MVSGTRDEIAAAAEEEAAKQGLYVYTDERIPQKTIIRMLSEQVKEEVAVSFFVTALPGENISESLICPIGRTLEEMSEALLPIERWADGFLRRVSGKELSLFFADGYGTTFTVRTGPALELAAQATQFVADTGDTAWLRMDLMA
jgi:hypothetical protein